MRITAGAVTQLIVKLREAELVTATPSPTDSRSIILALAGSPHPSFTACSTAGFGGRRGAQVRQLIFLFLRGAQTDRPSPHHAVEAYLSPITAPFTLPRPNFFMPKPSTTSAGSTRRPRTLPRTSAAVLVSRTSPETFVIIMPTSRYAHACVGTKTVPVRADPHWHAPPTTLRIAVVAHATQAGALTTRKARP